MDVKSTIPLYTDTQEMSVDEYKYHYNIPNLKINEYFDFLKESNRFFTPFLLVIGHFNKILTIYRDYGLGITFNT